MAKYPYVQTASKTASLFEAIRSRGKPAKVDVKWLEAAGFKSANDHAFRSFLTFLDLLDSKGVPTEKYDLIKASGDVWRRNLGDIVRTAYAPIFHDYPQANERTREQLIDQFAAADTSISNNVAGLVTTTFLAVCKVADFSGTPSMSAPVPPLAEAQVPSSGIAINGQAPIVPSSVQSSGSVDRALTININISLEIPSTEKAEVYDNLFKSMSEHLGDLMMQARSNG